MKTYIADIIPRVRKFSQRLDNETLLKKDPWVVIDENSSTKCLYIFRDNGNLIISQNGEVDEGKWDYLGSNRILIKRRGESFLFNNGFFNENVLALQVEGRSEYAFLVNETIFNQRQLTSLEQINNYLEIEYVKSRPSLENKEQSKDKVDTLVMVFVWIVIILVLISVIRAV